MPPLQAASLVTDELRKKKPFDPLSMKLVYFVPPVGKFVVAIPAVSSGITFALPRPLLARVPIPKTNNPDTEAAPLAGMLGSWMKEPLLSVAKPAIGFVI